MLRRRFLFTKVVEKKPVYTYIYTTTDGQILDLKSVQNHKYENGVGSFETYSKNCISFKSQYTLKSIVIPEGITSIGNYAFYNCSGLTSITIPNSITSIEYMAFYNCNNLKAVHISDLVSWCNIDFSDLYANPLYCAKNLYLNGELVTELIIPDDVTEIKNYAFYCCESITSVVIPSNVTSIEDYAFHNCENLKTVKNYSSLNLVKGSTDYGYVAYYADEVINM